MGLLEIFEEIENFFGLNLVIFGDFVQGQTDGPFPDDFAEKIILKFFGS